MHALLYWAWLLVDHDSAVDWMWMFGFGVFTHCFGETGVMSHVAEVTSVAVPTGFLFGFAGMLAAIIAMLRATDRKRRLFCALGFVLNLDIAIAGGALLGRLLLLHWTGAA